MINSTLNRSTLGTDAWDANNETLLLDHTGLAILGNPMDGVQFVQQPDLYIIELDEIFLSTSIIDIYDLSI